MEDITPVDLTLEVTYIQSYLCTLQGILGSSKTMDWMFLPPAHQPFCWQPPSQWDSIRKWDLGQGLGNRDNTFITAYCPYKNTPRERHHSFHYVRAQSHEKHLCSKASFYGMPPGEPKLRQDDWYQGVRALLQSRTLEVVYDKAGVGAAYGKSLYYYKGAFSERKVDRGREPSVMLENTKGILGK